MVHAAACKRLLELRDRRRMAEQAVDLAGA